MGLELFQRALRNAEELNERPRMLPAVALCDVRCHRNGRSTNLGGHSVHFFLWEFRGYAIASNGERNRLLPDAQIPIILDAAVLHALNPLLATPYSLLAHFAFSSPGST